MRIQSDGSFSLAAGKAACCAFPSWLPNSILNEVSFTHFHTCKNLSKGHIDFRSKAIASQSTNIYWYLWCTRYCARNWGFSGEYNKEDSHPWWAYMLKVHPAPKLSVPGSPAKPESSWRRDIQNSLSASKHLNSHTLKEKKGLGVAMGHKWVHWVKKGIQYRLTEEMDVSKNGIDCIIKYQTPDHGRYWQR